MGIRRCSRRATPDIVGKRAAVTPLLPAHAWLGGGNNNNGRTPTPTGVGMGKVSGRLRTAGPISA